MQFLRQFYFNISIYMYVGGCLIVATLQLCDSALQMKYLKCSIQSNISTFLIFLMLALATDRDSTVLVTQLGSNGEHGLTWNLSWWKKGMTMTTWSLSLRQASTPITLSRPLTTQAHKEFFK